MLPVISVLLLYITGDKVVCSQGHRDRGIAPQHELRHPPTQDDLL